MPRIAPERLAAVVARLQPSVAPRVPVGVAVAIAEVESTFDTTARPWTQSSSAALRRNGQPVLYDGRMVRSTALGLWQVLEGSIAQYGLNSLAERTDVEKSTRGALRQFASFAATVDAAGSVDPDDRAGLIYLGHNQGPGALARAVRQASRPLTLAKALQVLGQSPAGPWARVAARWDEYEGQYGRGAGFNPGMLVGGLAYNPAARAVAIVGGLAGAAYLLSRVMGAGRRSPLKVFA